MERSISSAKERAKRAVGGSVAGTKKEEKQNLRVRFLHTASRNYLILLIYLPHPSWAQRPVYGIDFSSFFFDIKSLGPAECTRIQARIRPFSPRFDFSGHTGAHTKKWPPAQNSRPAPGRSSTSQRSLRQRDLPASRRRWATDTERRVDRAETLTKSRIARLKTFGELIDLHIDDMCDVGKPPRRSKAAALGSPPTASWSRSGTRSTPSWLPGLYRSSARPWSSGHQRRR